MSGISREELLMELRGTYLRGTDTKETLGVNYHTSEDSIGKSSTGGYHTSNER